MSGWAFFFVLLGVVYMTQQIFSVIDLIDRPRRR
jgi:hypothetical protein